MGVSAGLITCKSQVSFAHGKIRLRVDSNGNSAALCRARTPTTWLVRGSHMVRSGLRSRTKPAHLHRSLPPGMGNGSHFATDTAAGTGGGVLTFPGNDQFLQASAERTAAKKICAERSTATLRLTRSPCDQNSSENIHVAKRTSAASSDSHPCLLLDTTNQNCG